MGQIARKDTYLATRACNMMIANKGSQNATEQGRCVETRMIIIELLNGSFV